MTRRSLTGGRVVTGAFEVWDCGFAPRPWPGGSVWQEGVTPCPAEQGWAAPWSQATGRAALDRD